MFTILMSVSDEKNLVIGKIKKITSGHTNVFLSSYLSKIMRINYH